MKQAFVIMVNDFPECIALTEGAANDAVSALKKTHGEPEAGSYKVRYIRAVLVTVV